jgi:hypothetical protein
MLGKANGRLGSLEASPKTLIMLTLGPGTRTILYHSKSKNRGTGLLRELKIFSPGNPRRPLKNVYLSSLHYRARSLRVKVEATIIITLLSRVNSNFLSLLCSIRIGIIRLSPLTITTITNQLTMETV